MELFAPRKFGVFGEESRRKLQEFVGVHKDILTYFKGLQNSFEVCIAQQDDEKAGEWLKTIEEQILTLYKLKFLVENVLNDASADPFMRERAEFVKSTMNLASISELSGLFVVYHANRSKNLDSIEQPDKQVQKVDIDAQIIRFLNRISIQSTLDFSVLKNYIQFERVAGLRSEFIDFFFVVEELVDLMNKLIVEDFVFVEEEHKVTDSSGRTLVDTKLLNSISAIQFYYGRLKKYQEEKQLSEELREDSEATSHFIAELESSEIIDCTKLIETFLLGSPTAVSSVLERKQKRQNVQAYCLLLTELIEKKILVPLFIDGTKKAQQFYVLDKNRVIIDFTVIKSHKQLQQQFQLLQTLECDFDGVEIEAWKKEAVLEFAKVDVLIGQLAFHGLEYGATSLQKKLLDTLSYPCPLKVSELSQFSTCFEVITSILFDELFEGKLVYEVEDRTHYLQFSSFDFLKKIALIQDHELSTLESLEELCQRLKVFYRHVQRIDSEMAIKSNQIAKQIVTHIAQENDLAVSGFRFSSYNPAMDKVFGTLYQFLEQEVAKIDNYFVGRDCIFQEHLTITLDMVKLYNSLVFKGVHDDFRTRDPEYPPQKKLFSGSQLVSFESVSDTLSILRSVLITMEKEAQREEEMEDTYPIVERMIAMNNSAYRRLPFLKEHLLSNNQQFFHKIDQKYILSPNTTESQLKELCFEKGYSFVEFHNFLLQLERFVSLYLELGVYLYTFRPLRNGTNTLANYYVFTPIIPENNSFLSVLKKVFVGSNVVNSAIFNERYERFKRQKISSRDFKDISYLENVNETLEEWKSLLYEYRLLELTEGKYDDVET